MERLETIVNRYASILRAGQSVELSAHQVEHPAHRPELFARLPVAWPVGQHCDFVHRVRDGSRIHAQCFVRDGQSKIRFHRDHWDPEASLGHWLCHGLFETPAGSALLGFAAIALIVGVVSR